MSKVKACLNLFAVLMLVSWPRIGITGKVDIQSHQKAIDAFFAQKLRDQISDFTNHSFEEQYAIYVYGSQVRHPPAIYLAQPFGSEGEKVVEPLTQKLIAAHDDLTIRDLVTIFAEVGNQKTYDVAGDERLMKLLNSAVDRMKNADWKAIAAKELQSIRALKPTN